MSCWRWCCCTWTGSGPSATSREPGIPLTTAQSEVARLAQGGILATRKVGGARVVRANADSPAVAPLTQLTLVTFGSWAARFHGEAGSLPADIDVVVAGDGVDRADLYASAERAEARLRMPVNPVLRSSGSGESPKGDALMLEVRDGPTVRRRT